MPRIAQKPGTRGSQKWLQALVNEYPDHLDELLRLPLGLRRADQIKWLSPKVDDNYSEYRDRDFLEQLGLRLENRSLESFWPSGGPVWDGAGHSSRGDIILIEAKSHIAELSSNCKAGDHARQLIEESLMETAGSFSATSPTNWISRYYQYANRLAHLFLLRQQNNIPAWLCFVYFVNDESVGGPTSAAEWQAAISDIHAHLGITKENLGPYVLDIFVDVRVMRGLAG